MSTRKFLADNLKVGFNPASKTMGNPKGLQVIERKGIKYFRTVSALGGTSTTEYLVGSGEITLDTITGKVCFNPTAEGSAKDPNYAMIVPPNCGKLNHTVKQLIKDFGSPEKYFHCGGKPQKCRNGENDHPKMSVTEAIEIARSKGYRKFYVV